MLSQEGVSPPFQTIPAVDAISPVHPATYSPPAESAWADTTNAGVTADQAWNAATLKFNVEPQNGAYTVEAGSPFVVDSFTYVDGTPVSQDDYKVVYFKESNNSSTLDAGDLVVSSTNNADDKKPGGMPTVVGTYYAVVVDAIPGTGIVTDSWTWDNVWETMPCKKIQKFTVVDSTVSLDGAFAFEPVAAGETETYADTAFKYDGGAIDVKIAVNGKTVDLSKVNAVWYNGSATYSSGDNKFTVTDAGDYKVILTGNGTDYTGTATVEFTVDPIDLTKDSVAAGVYDNDSSKIALEEVKNSGGDTFVYDKLADVSKATVNGKELDSNAGIVFELLSVNGVESKSHINNATTLGKYDFKVYASDPESKNVLGDALVSAYVVDQKAAFHYGDIDFKNAAGNDLDGKVFNASKGQAFDPSLLYATVGGDEEVDMTYTVTKDGKEVTSYTEPGTYVVTADVAVADDYAYAGHESATFTVVSKTLVNPTAYVSVDGKNFNGGEIGEYTGSAYEPTVIVKEGKDGKSTLVEGEDYTVTYYDAEGNKVDSLVEVGDYKMVIEYAGDAHADQTMNFSIGKASIDSACATAEFFATDGETPVVPTFLGYTKTGLKGQEFALSADEISVTYYSTWTDDTADSDGKGVVEADELSNEVKADKLAAAGTYYAKITVLKTAKNIDAANVLVAKFVLSEQAKFADVDANAWYAEPVYTAASDGFKYMTGLAGTSLFMPEAQITRAQVAQVFYNMAGGKDFDWSNAAFDDVVSGEWYGPAIAWASQAGIVTGYEGTNDFGPEDNATREQVATMIYRYTKAQGKDVTVSDEAAALAKYADGASVSDYAKTAMAWCVEKGVFGVDTDSLRPQDNMSRAEMAATSVRVQPDGAYTEL